MEALSCVMPTVPTFTVCVCSTSSSPWETWESPWRVLIIGTLSDVVESTLVTDVSDPSTVEDTSWIKPGSASWIYWAYNHGTRDYQLLKEYFDLAAEMKWPYSLIDWEWDQMGNGGNLEDAVKYAHERGVKPLLWYNSSTNWLGPTPLYRLNKPEDRAKEYEWLNKLGISGIKVDFFRRRQYFFHGLLHRLVGGCG